jgi:MSHA biogenesis protein MshP
MIMTTRIAQSGSALIGALFLIIVVSALGAFAINLQANQRQEGMLQLLQQRVEFAARSGIEYWIYQIENSAACSSGSGPEFGNQPEFAQIRLDTVCSAILTGAGSTTVYSIEVQASYGNFGDPDFVRRSSQRTIIR